MPVVPGHQIVGTVDALGPGCRRLRLGQRIGAAWLRWTCGRCRFCTSGTREPLRVGPLHRLPGRRRLRRVRRACREAFAYEIPEVFGDVEAAPLLCAGIIGYRALKRSHLPPGGRLAMYGFGSSAHVLIQIARHRGCEVYVVTRDEKHRELARQMGAVWVGGRAGGTAGRGR